VNALESFVGSASILLFGFITIPLAGWAVGLTMTSGQGAAMSLIFFVGRFLVLWGVRTLFHRLGIAWSR
jgi:hypothetical protein